MRLAAFHPSFFTVPVTFTPSSDGSELHGDPVESPGVPAVVNAYVEPFVPPPARSDSAGQPLAVRFWSVYTPADPGVVLDDAVSWAGVSATAEGTASDQTNGQGLLWRTVCREVT